MNGETRQWSAALAGRCDTRPASAERVAPNPQQADFADGRDSQRLPDITLKLQQRLTVNELRLEEILADTAGPPERLLKWQYLRLTGGVEDYGLDTRLWQV